MGEAAAGGEFKWPDPTTLLITTHGGFLMGGKYPFEFSIPKGMTVVKLSAVAPGCTNFLCPVVSSKVLEKANELFRDGEAAAEALPAAMKPFDKELLSYAESRKEWKDAANEIRRSADKRQQLITYTEDTKMYDKTYYRSDAEAKEAGCRWKIRMVNPPPGAPPDMFPVIMRNYPAGPPVRTAWGAPPPRAMGTIRLSEMVYDLYAKGVRKLFLLDYSCQHFPGLPPRGEREARRRFEDVKKNGGRSKTKRRFRKTRKAHGVPQTRSVAVSGGKQATRRRERARK